MHFVMESDAVQVICQRSEPFNIFVICNAVACLPFEGASFRVFDDLVACLEHIGHDNVFQITDEMAGKHVIELVEPLYKPFKLIPECGNRRIFSVGHPGLRTADPYPHTDYGIASEKDPVSLVKITAVAALVSWEKDKLNLIAPAQIKYRTVRTTDYLILFERDDIVPVEIGPNPVALFVEEVVPNVGSICFCR